MKDKCYKDCCEMSNESKLGIKPFTDEFDQFHAYQFSSNCDQSSFEVNFEKTRAHFEKPKEVYTQHGPKNNNLSHISHSYYILGESRVSLSPIFQDS